MRTFKHIPSGRFLIEPPKTFGTNWIFADKPNVGIQPEIAEDLIKGKDWVEVAGQRPIYNILSFFLNTIGKESNKVNLINNEWIDKDGDKWYYSDLITFTKCIHSVRRGSDGEIFTIGDEAYTTRFQSRQKINSIRLEDGEIIIYTDDYGFRLSMANKVKPKEWEITAFKSAINGEVYPLNTSPMCGKNPGDTVYSVKRLSDNVEFKVCDMIELKSGNRCKIKSFVFYNENCIYFVNDSKSHVYFDGRLAKPYKKEKLFTTEDGVDIYEGNEFWSVKNATEKVLHTIVGCTHNPNFLGKRFSTKQAAEEYILMNKSCLSINDVKGVHTGDCFTYNGMLKELEKLVKYKL